MSDVPFHRTRMGQIFFEVTVPALVREIARLNTNLERLATRAARDDRSETPTAATASR